MISVTLYTLMTLSFEHLYAWAPATPSCATFG
jgi:hypothetical protein